MSYQVLARKWRPRQFSELVGQQHVKTALANALTSSRLHHAYLFTGTRGVGKTTIARIFAKSLNCETGVTATPCGVCSACLEIDAGNFVDLMEIDAASRTKVEDTRDLLDNVQYAPSRGRFKVYLIDEVHMLSRHSFNALLKTLEEPPPHVKFLLATTDPQKLPVTVLSRCLQFSLKALTVAQIEQHLAHVLTAENMPFDAAALTLLAKAAKGSLRDSLSLTDQAIALTNGHITLEPIRQMLGLLDTSWSVQLLAALLAADLPQLQQVLHSLLAQQSDYQQVLDDMLGLLHLTALTQLQPAAAALSEQAEFIQQLALQQTPEAVQLYYQLLLSGKKDLPYAPEPLMGLEMALLRAMAFVPSTMAAAVSAATPSAVPSPLSSALPIISSRPTQVAATTTATPVSNDVNLTSEPEAETALTPATNTDIADATLHSSGIDAGTARIMQRRGVVIPTVTQPLKPPSAVLSTPSVSSTAVQSPATTHTAHGSVTSEPSLQVAQDNIVATEKKFERQSALQQSVPARHLTHQPLHEQSSGVIDTFMPSTESPPFSADAEGYEQQDESVSFADQQALSEAWWQQQHFEPLPTDDTDVLDEQRFSIRFAAQVDAWSRLIEQLPVGGLMRLYLLHSAMAQAQNTVTLTVAQSQQHLDKGEFRQTLYTAISPVFAAGFTLVIDYQHEVNDSPIRIQQRIELERKEYVSRLMQQDPIVQALQQRFAAQLQLETLQVN
ncbi:DNA polymerase III subunit gamma/tau [Alishewanella tabrizica]|uniref:DNA polymerase III subunit gamma/tau n=1 Tax=Alishewanella tabrizica TaxID=671278 RepID=A0ABQ2WGE5_9ALTE|nr:DNA polymerase III subunit gamma/tau [Alishewanella tabrizica]GGW51149.1 DNA polymerase III subunit gamma/tau [Alishewanella tabrizica]